MGRPKKPKPPNPNSKRAYLSKHRKKLGLYPVTSILTEEHLDALVKLAFLPPSQRASKPDIQNALATYLYRNLVQYYEHTPWAKAAREQRLAARSRGRQQPPTQPPQPTPNSHQTTP
jgi:hypothetical protein